MIEMSNHEDERREQFLAFRDRLFDVAADSIERATVPIIHGEGQQLIEGRSGLLFQIADLQYLVTAGHGMVEHLEAKRLPQVVMSETDKHPIILHLEEFRKTEDEQLDLAVMQLHPTTVHYISRHFTPLRLDAVMRRDDRRQGAGMYMLAGYPIANHEPDGKGSNIANNWKYLTYTYDGNYDDVDQYNPMSHLIVKYKRETKNYRGKTISPSGLSGCGVWFVGDPLSKKLFMPEDFKLVGIQTAWRPEYQYAKCTWIDHVLGVIWRYFPDARSPLRIHGINF